MGSAALGTSSNQSDPPENMLGSFGLVGNSGATSSAGAATKALPSANQNSLAGASAAPTATNVKAAAKPTTMSQVVLPKSSPQVATPTSPLPAPPPTQYGAFGQPTTGRSTTSPNAFGIPAAAPPPAAMTGAQLTDAGGTGANGLLNPLSTAQQQGIEALQSPTGGIMNGGPLSNASATQMAKQAQSTTARGSATINWAKALPGAAAFSTSPQGVTMKSDMTAGNYTKAFQDAAQNGGLKYLLHGDTLKTMGVNITSKAQEEAFYAAAAPYIDKMQGQASYGQGHIGGDFGTAWGKDTQASADANWAASGGKSTDLAQYASNDKAYEAQNRQDNVDMGEFALETAGMFLTAGGAAGALGAAVGAGTGAGGAAAGGAIIGAGEGAAGAKLGGGDVLKGALTGGATGAASGYLSHGGAQDISNETGGMASPGAIKIGSSALSGGLTGGIKGALTGGALSAGGQAISGSTPNMPDTGQLGSVARQIGAVAAPVAAAGMMNSNRDANYSGPSAPNPGTINPSQATAANQRQPALTPSNAATVTPLEAHRQQRVATAQRAQQMARYRAARKARYA